VAARDAWKEQQPQMNAKQLVFFDESSFNLAMKRAAGWALRGVTPIIEAPAKGTAVTVMGAIGLEGPRAMRIHKGGVNGEVLLDYLREDLGPTLKPGDIVVMDGPRLHRIAGVAEVLAEFGATVLYLPAYSPELNPIEMAWAWCKDKIRGIAPRHLSRLKQKLWEKWEAIDAEACAGWFRHSGYHVPLST
jgi:transposase